MKKISVILAIILSVSLAFTSCTKDEIKPADSNIMPENFRVEIPASLMSESVKKSTNGDELQGNDIYEHLTTFIDAGDNAAEIVSDIIRAIHLYNLSKPQEFDFKGDEDTRIKHVVIVENSSFDGKEWQYQLTITDKESEGNEDGGLGLQIFWNKNPVEGIAILKPHNIDRGTEVVFAEAMCRIDYSEVGTNYEQEMTVYIAGLNLELQDKYGIETLKMNVGKDGNLIEVFGNSNHPNASFFTEDIGFNWAFVAAGSNVSEIGVAEVALPPSNLNSNDRQVILKDYSLKNVFTEQINEALPGISQETIDWYLQNTEAPGYFNNQGFVQGGTSSGAEYDVFETAINDLTPYNPIEVSNLTIAFKTE
jgi:hypothetical protein